MVVRDIEAPERLAESADVIDNLPRVAQRILRVDDDGLRRQLDDMRVDVPAVVGRGVGVDADVVALRRYQLAGHAFSSWAAVVSPPAGGTGSAMSVAMRQPCDVRIHSRIIRNGFGTGSVRRSQR